MVLLALARNPHSFDPAPFATCCRCRRPPLGRLCQLHPGAGLQPGHTRGGVPCTLLHARCSRCRRSWHMATNLHTGLPATIDVVFFCCSGEAVHGMHRRCNKSNSAQRQVLCPSHCTPPNPALRQTALHRSRLVITGDVSSSSSCGVWRRAGRIKLAVSPPSQPRPLRFRPAAGVRTAAAGGGL